MKKNDKVKVWYDEDADQIRMNHAGSESTHLQAWGWTVFSGCCTIALVVGLATPYWQAGIVGVLGLAVFYYFLERSGE